MEVKKVWVVSFKSKDISQYYPMLVVDNPTREIKSAISRFLEQRGTLYDTDHIDFEDYIISQVIFYGT